MRPLQTDWEGENLVPRLPGWSFRARRMIKGMPHMLFPRYIGRDGRDFMYLTLRSVLPGSPLIPRVQPPEPNEGVWRTKGLPQHGFPYALATTVIRPDAKQPQIHARVVKIDPRTIKVAGKESSGKETVLSLAAGTHEPKSGPQLWLASRNRAQSERPPPDRPRCRSSSAKQRSRPRSPPRRRSPA